MANIEVAVISASRTPGVDDAAVEKLVAVLQRQVSDHLAPAWGVDARLTAVRRGEQPLPGSWWLAILDDSDQAGALGYHDVTNEGLPLGKVFAGSDARFGYNWTVTTSHELLEMLIDPDINLAVFRETKGRRGVLYAYEVCDPCGDDAFAYRIGDTLVSDFVHPTWFEDFRTSGSTRFDQGNRIRRPFELLKGGHIGVFDIAAGTGWHQLTHEDSSPAFEARPRVGSRRERRRTPRDQWLRSMAGR